MIAFLIMTPVVGRDVWRLRRVVMKHLRWLIVLGLLGMSACQGLGYYAAGFTSATNMAILLSLVPLLTMILTAVFVRERPASLAMFGGLISLVGFLSCSGVVTPHASRRRA